MTSVYDWMSENDRWDIDTCDPNYEHGCAWCINDRKPVDDAEWVLQHLAKNVMVQALNGTWLEVELEDWLEDHWKQMSAFAEKHCITGLCEPDSEDWEESVWFACHIVDDLMTGNYSATAYSYLRALLEGNPLDCCRWGYVCKHCGESFMTSAPANDSRLIEEWYESEGMEERLWGHIQSEHEELFKDLCNLDTPDMLEECYDWDESVLIVMEVQ